MPGIFHLNMMFSRFTHTVENDRSFLWLYYSPEYEKEKKSRIEPGVVVHTIPALQKLRQEDRHEFEARLGYILSPGQPKLYNETA